ncbi:MAG: hypothetical protein IJ572_00150 [Bacilli bacterium]|nr:hypothetical protein [Bacilli bacterium]
MKEATGELNMTVVTVVAIAAVGAFFYAFIWPSIQANLRAQTYCSSAVNCDCSSGDGKTCTCHYYDDNMQMSQDTIVCDADSSHGR